MIDLNQLSKNSTTLADLWIRAPKGMVSNDNIVALRTLEKKPINN